MHCAWYAKRMNPYRDYIDDENDNDHDMNWMAMIRCSFINILLIAFSALQSVELCASSSLPPPLALFLSVCSIHSLCCVAAGCVSLYIRVCCWCIRCTIAPARITIQTGDQTSQRHKAKQHTNITRTNVERYGKNRNGHQLKFILYVTHSVWTAFPSNSCLQSFGKYVQCYATGVTKYIDDCIWLFF